MIEREILKGGVNEVVRVGDKVHRPTGPWSPRVHELLRHLRKRGFTGAPRFHGLTPDGLEILDFLPGEVSLHPLDLDSAADLLRDYHQATLGFPHVDGWEQPAMEPAEVICHGDFATYNCVFDGARYTGVFDFDHARPGPRLYDVSYAVYRWAPLTRPGSNDARGTAEEQAVRLGRFCDRYGLSPTDRAGLIDAIVARLRGMVDYMRAQAAAGSAAFAGHLEAGHHLQYLGDAEHVLQHRPLFEGAVVADH